MNDNFLTALHRFPSPSPPLWWCRIYWPFELRIFSMAVHFWRHRHQFLFAIIIIIMSCLLRCSDLPPIPIKMQGICYFLIIFSFFIKKIKQYKLILKTNSSNMSAWSANNQHLGVFRATAIITPLSLTVVGKVNKKTPDIDVTYSCGQSAQNCCDWNRNPINFSILQTAAPLIWKRAYVCVFAGTYANAVLFGGNPWNYFNTIKF